jgi:membrane associated rhomboid family serine protease
LIKGEFSKILSGPTTICALIIIVHVFEIFAGIQLSYYGIVPREISGLLGIFTAPFLHGSFEHLNSNLFSLFSLLLLTRYFYERVFTPVLTIIWIGTGLLVWLFGKENTYHIGASGLVYGLISFVFFSGFFRGNAKSVMISLTVLVLHASFFEGFLPKEGISWQSHFYGAILGMVLSFVVKSIHEPWETELVENNKEEKEKYLLSDVFQYTKVERYQKYIEEQERLALEREMEEQASREIE